MMWVCTITHSKILWMCAVMHVAYYAVKGSRNIELACLKKKKERKKIILPVLRVSWFGTFAMLSCAIGSLFGHENTRR